MPAVEFKTVWALLQAAINDPDLTPVDKIVLARLLYHRNGKTGRCNPSYATLAEGTSIDRRRVMRSIKRMELGDWVTVLRAPKERARKPGGLPSNSFGFNWGRVLSTTETTTLVTRKPLPSDTKTTTPSDKTTPSPSDTDATQNLESLNHEVLNLDAAPAALRSKERATVPEWAIPAGSGKWFVKVHSEGGDCIRRQCESQRTLLPIISRQQDAFIVDELPLLTEVAA